MQVLKLLPWEGIELVSAQSQLGAVSQTWLHHVYVWTPPGINEVSVYVSL